MEPQSVDQLDVRITAMGIQTPHPPDFTVDRPGGMPEGEYLLMCFSTPFLTQSATGWVVGRPGDCVLHDPLFPQWHGPAPGSDRPFCNDWIHIAGDRPGPLAERYAIPLNAVISTGDGGLFTRYLTAIDQEMFRKEPRWEDAVAIDVECMFLALARGMEMEARGQSLGPGERTHRQAFVLLRDEIHETLKETWDAARMAREVGLGISRFSVLYRKFFGVSPVDDLVRMRVALACDQLAEGRWSVAEVASRCGFASPQYFSRVFRARQGCSPRGFARAFASGSVSP